MPFLFINTYYTFVDAYADVSMKFIPYFFANFSPSSYDTCRLIII